jgi:hypothetical protein
VAAGDQALRLEVNGKLYTTIPQTAASLPYQLHTSLRPKGLMADWYRRRIDRDEFLDKRNRVDAH